MQTLPVEQLVGKTVGETYLLEQLLGSGALTAAYAGQYTGHQHTHQQRVMITAFLIPEKLSAVASERFQARFLREAKVLTDLEHKHILPVYAFGVQYDYPYLVAPFAQASSLAHVLKDRERFSAEETSALLTQIADGLDYAHRNGVVHGSLSPATVLLDEKHAASIAGFGFVRILAQQGIVDVQHQYAHLLNVANTFLGVPAYIAPECVQGAQPDARADVYALGLIIFQLLSGTTPFVGGNPLEIALQRVQQPIPSLHDIVPDIPVALDLIVQRALEQKPVQRYQSAGELARAFARALKVLHRATKEPEAKVTSASDSQVTQLPNVNWLNDTLANASGNTSRETAKQPVVSAPSAQQDAGNWQFTPPIVTAKLPTIPATSIATQSIEDNVVSIDPFVWWSTSAMPQVEQQTPGTFAQKRTTGLASTRRKPAMKSRRQILVLAGGGVVAAGVPGVAGISLAHIMHKAAPLQVATGQSATTTQGNTPATSSSPTSTRGTGTGANGQVHTTPTAAHGQTPTSAPVQKAAPTPKPTMGTQAGPTPQPTTAPQPTPTPQPTQPPTPTPTPPPQHTGTVIGSTSQSTNSAQGFNNPADGQGSLLIHLPNGSFVACERSCTHAGVPVNYDSGSGKLVCPAHGAVFDPQNGFNHISGPGNGPLRTVSIRVNSDGTITTG